MLDKDDSKLIPSQLNNKLIKKFYKFYDYIYYYYIFIIIYNNYFFINIKKSY